jgi:HlyD family secretion protein
MGHLAGCLRVCAYAAIACAGAALGGCNDRPNGDADTAPSGPRTIVALGRIEPSGGVLEIGAVPGDVLQDFAPGIVEGATVAAGEEMGRLESYDLRKSQLDAIDAKMTLGEKEEKQKLAVAEANLKQAIAAHAEVVAKLEELEAQAEALTILEESARIAQTDYQSLLELKGSDPDLVTEIQLRRKKNLAARAQQEFEVQSRTHAAAKKAAEAAVAAAVENVGLAELNVELAKEVKPNLVTAIERKVAAETLEQSILRAPAVRKGGAEQFTVLKVFVEPGEFITQLPVFQIGDLSRMTCIAEVYEADVKEIVVGQEATIRSPAFGGPYADDGAADGGSGIKGTVKRVGSLVSGGELIQRNPLAPSDRSIVEVLIEIGGDGEEAARSATAEAARHIGMQVTVTFGKKPAGSSAGAAAAPTTEDAPPSDELETRTGSASDPAS